MDVAPLEHHAPTGSTGPPTQVDIVAADPLLRAGAASEIAGCPEVTVVSPGAPADVVVVVVDQVSDTALDGVREARRTRHRAEILLVCPDFTPSEALRAIVAGVRGLVRRGDASGDRLTRTVVAIAGGDCSVPPDVLDPILAPEHATRSEDSDLSEREQAVLALVAHGWETTEIARELSYSPRTITSVLHDITQRLRLRNRTHAVAYALRAGLL